MPINLRDDDSWKTPTAITVYDSGWESIDVAYVYDMGIWKVVFPDSIIPSVSIYLGPIVNRTNVYVEFDLINSDYIIVELFSGTGQSSLLQSQTIDTNHTTTDRKPVTFAGLSGNTTYNIKVTAYSITENTATFLTGSFTTPAATNLTASPFPDLTGASVSWNAPGQSAWRVIIRRSSDFSEVYRSSSGLSPGTTSNINAYFGALFNTQYTVQLDLEYSGGGVSNDYTSFTTPNVVQPVITSIFTSVACDSITANWSGNNYISAKIQLLEVNFVNGQWEPGFIIDGPILYGTSPTSHKFSGLQTQTTYGLILTLTSPTGQTVTSTTYNGGLWVAATSSPSIGAPTNFSASSDVYGKVLVFSWNTPTAPCTGIDGYRIEYKLSTSGTWLLLSDLISGSATTFGAGGIGNSTFSPNTSYNFRIYAEGSFYESPPASTSITTANGPFDIVISGTSPVEVYSSSTLTGQLRNADSQNIYLFGRSVSWSVSGPSGSYVSPTSSITDAFGRAVTTFYAGSSTGSGTVYASTSGQWPSANNSKNMTVIPAQGIVPSLSAAGTIKGVSFTNTNYNSLYSYSATAGYPTKGSIEPGDSYNNSQFDVLITRTRTVRNTISKSGRTATTTNPDFDSNPLVSMSITSFRPGYESGVSSVSSATPTIVISTRQYLWQQSTDGGSSWNSNWNSNFSNTTSKTMGWSSGVNSRMIRCRVTTIFSSGQQDTSFSTNTLTIP